MCFISKWLKNLFNGNNNNHHYPVDKVHLGMQLFSSYPDNLAQLDKAMLLPINRIRTWLTPKNYDRHSFAQFLNKARIFNFAVLVTLWDEDNPQDTYKLAGELARNHAIQNDLYMYQIGNEPNHTVTPVTPKDYFKIYVDCFNAIRKARADTHIYPAGLTAIKGVCAYIDQLQALGIEKYIKDPIRQSAWCFHFYKGMWDRAGKVIQKVRKCAEDEVFCTEFGCPISEGYKKQKYWFDLGMKKAKQYGISQMFYYGLCHAGNILEPKDDFGLLDDNLVAREMYYYIKNEWNENNRKKI